MIGIYKITSPSGKVYVGQSVNINRRLRKYKILNCKGQIILYRSFMKYGVEKHKFEILEECESKELNIKERYYQDMFKCMSKDGLNCVLTETNTQRRIINEETRLKISIAHKGKFVKEETRKKISDSRKGKCLGVKKSEETKLKMSKALKGHKRNLGNKHSLETKIKMSSWQIGRKLSKEHCENIGLSKKGCKYNCKVILNNLTGIFYNGVKEASDSCYIKPSTLKSMLNGGRKNKTNLMYV